MSLSDQLVDIYLLQTAQGIFLTHLKEEKADTFIFEAQNTSMRPKDIYLGRVQRLERGRAWVDIGLSKAALLSAPSTRMTVGEKVCVQIERVPLISSDTRLSKGPLVSSKSFKLVPSVNKIGKIKGADPFWVTYLKEQTASLMILTNAQAIFHQVQTLFLSHEVSLKSDVKLSSDLRQCWESIRMPLVTIKGGGSLLIEEGETLTAIDVNTSDGDTSRLVSLEKETDLRRFFDRAWQEIRQQILQRDLGGLIVIDFPRLGQPSLLTGLLEKMTLPNATLWGFTRAGLFEITRRRTQPSLTQRLNKAYGHHPINFDGECYV